MGGPGAGASRGKEDRHEQAEGLQWESAPSVVHGVGTFRDDYRGRRDTMQRVPDNSHAGLVVQWECIATHRLLQLSFGASHLQTALRSLSNHETTTVHMPC